MSARATRKKAASKSSVSNGAQEGPDATLEGLSFEGALERLETTVGRLEEGEMPLEEALELFEQGVALSRRCSTTLEAAEQRIEILIADRDALSDAEDAWTTEPFEGDDEEEDDDFDA